MNNRMKQNVQVFVDRFQTQFFDILLYYLYLGPIRTEKPVNQCFGPSLAKKIRARNGLVQTYLLWYSGKNPNPIGICFLWTVDFAKAAPALWYDAIGAPRVSTSNRKVWPKTKTLIWKNVTGLSSLWGQNGHLKNFHENFQREFPTKMATN